MFRALAVSMTGDDKSHAQIRNAVVDYLEDQRDDLLSFYVPETMGPFANDA